MTTTSFHLSLVLAAISLFALAIAGQRSPDPELRTFLDCADKEINKYTRTFRDLTAVEDRTDEIFDRSGKLKKKRGIVSDLIVLESRFDQDVREYLIVREVDGKPLKNSNKRALNFISKLQRKNTDDKELEAIRRENLRYVIGVQTYGFILSPTNVLSPKLAPYIDFRRIGRETVGGSDAILVEFRQTAQTPDLDFKIMAPSELQVTHAFWSGRLWLDPSTGSLLRIETESAIVSERFTEPFVFLRQTAEFQSSDFDINVPKLVIWETFNPRFDKKLFKRENGRIAPASAIAVRSTTEYGKFRKFEVTVEGP